MKMIILKQVLQVQAYIKCGSRWMGEMCLKRINATVRDAVAGVGS